MLQTTRREAQAELTRTPAEAESINLNHDGVMGNEAWSETRHTHAMRLSFGPGVIPLDNHDAEPRKKTKIVCF